MSKVQFINTRYRGVYDGNTLYRMFDEVLDVAGGTRYMLLAAEARGQACKDLNLWAPVVDFVEPITLEGLLVAFRECSGNGVLSGMEVTAQETEDLTVAVSEGVCYMPSGARLEVDAVEALVIATTEALKNKKAIVYVSSAGVVTALGAFGTTAVAGAKTFTVATNAVATDTVTIAGVEFTAVASEATGAQFNVGVDAAATAAGFAAVLDANATVGATYDAVAVGAAITLTEKDIGGGDTPADATFTGTVVITNGTATTSAAAGTATASALPAGGVLLAEIAVAAAATTIVTGNITKKRKTLVADAVFKTETA